MKVEYTINIGRKKLINFVCHLDSSCNIFQRWANIFGNAFKNCFNVSMIS